MGSHVEMSVKCVTLWIDIYSWVHSLSAWASKFHLIVTKQHTIASTYWLIIVTMSLWSSANSTSKSFKSISSYIHKIIYMDLVSPLVSPDQGLATGHKTSPHIWISTYHKVLWADWAFMWLAFLQPKPDNIMLIPWNLKTNNSD